MRNRSHQVFFFLEAMVHQFMDVSSNSHDKAKSKSSPQVWAAYGLFAVCGLTIYHFVANGEFSAIMTMSVMCQCLSFAVLGLQIAQDKAVSSISARSLGLELISLVCRSSSTITHEGYLPVDPTGDFIFQGLDVCSMCLVVGLLYMVMVKYKDSYQEEEDSLPMIPLVLVSFLIAVIFHADMNDRPLFDTLWMTGLIAGVLSVLPQLWLITRAGGVIQACMSHYIALSALSRFLSGCFMWEARHDVTCVYWIEGVEHAIWMILAAHALHMILLGDFGYHYAKAIMHQGLNCQITLPECAEMV